jgi:hypothetical protein
MHCEPKYYIRYHDWLKTRKPRLNSGLLFFVNYVQSSSGWSIKQATHIYLVPRSGMVGVLLLSPACLYDIVLSHSSSFIHCIELRSTTMTVLPFQGDNMVLKLGL